MKLTVALTTVVFLAATASAGCVLSLRYEEGEIRWKPVPGAELYQVQESFNELASSRNFATTRQSFKVDHRVTAPTLVSYRVYAEVSTLVANGGPAATNVPGCSARIDIQLQPDAELRSITRRVVLPLVGSTPGAFGGRFKTYLKLTASNSLQKGKIVFHPAGKAASDGDPSIPYSLGITGDTLVFDDVLADMGQSGIGSIDVIPDESGDPVVPLVEARLFNDTASGTFGTQAFPIFPIDYLRPASVRFAPPDPRFRLNVGFRTLSDATLTFLIYGTDGRLRDFRDRKFPAGWMQMTSLSELVGAEITTGESVLVSFSGVVIPFHTLTENRTNDPTLIVAEPRARSLNVGSYVD